MDLLPVEGKSGYIGRGPREHRTNPERAQPWGHRVRVQARQSSVDRSGFADVHVPKGLRLLFGVERTDPIEPEAELTSSLIPLRKSSHSPRDEVDLIFA